MNENAAGGPAIARPATVPLVRLIDVGVRRETLLDAMSFDVEKCVVFSNVTAHNPEFGRHLERDVYVARRCSLQKVDLVQLPGADTALNGADHVLKVGETLVEEQYPVFYGREDAELRRHVQLDAAAAAIEPEVLLVSRYGIFTWGHWLGELLPKAVVVEAAFPGRFRYAVPAQVVTEPRPDLPWSRIRQSLHAYGITDERLWPLRADQTHRFRRLFAVTSVWSDHMLHPNAFEAMRRPAFAQARSERFLTSIKRLPGYGRTLDNYPEIEVVLRERGFVGRTTGAMSFPEQAETFAAARAVFSVLGSDLVNLLFAPEGVKVITAAPPNFGDRFFYALVQLAGGQFVDLRGPITRANEEVPHKADLRLDVGDLIRALDALALP